MVGSVWKFSALPGDLMQSCLRLMVWFRAVEELRKRGSVVAALVVDGFCDVNMISFHRVEASVLYIKCNH